MSSPNSTAPHKMVQVSVITGFLGSGKTTLIGRMLRTPGFGRTAVIVNEFGEIGLDHELIAKSDESLLTLTNGCICCAIRGDLVQTLLDLQSKRENGLVEFDRVLIETSGLADPVPILHALMTDRDAVANYVVGCIITVVDAVHGDTTLDRHTEARRQAALADTLVLSKTDLVDQTAALRDRLSGLNPGALVVDASAITADVLFAQVDSAARASRLADVPDQPIAFPFSQARHSDGIETFSLRRDTAMPALALTLLLQALTEHCGIRLLRVKGLVEIAEMPGRPAVIQGVQHVFSPPEFLDRWPSEDRTTRIVFIARDVPRYFPSRLLAAIEAEVRDTAPATPPTTGALLDEIRGLPKNGPE